MNMLMHGCSYTISMVIKILRRCRDLSMSKDPSLSKYSAPRGSMFKISCWVCLYQTRFSYTYLWCFEASPDCEENQRVHSFCNIFPICFYCVRHHLVLDNMARGVWHQKRRPPCLLGPIVMTTLDNGSPHRLRLSVPNREAHASPP